MVWAANILLNKENTKVENIKVYDYDTSLGNDSVFDLVYDIFKEEYGFRPCIEKVEGALEEILQKDYALMYKDGLGFIFFIYTSKKPNFSTISHKCRNRYDALNVFIPTDFLHLK